MTDTEFTDLTEQCLNARDAYVANLAVLSAENAQLKTAIARKDVLIESLERTQIPALPKAAPGTQWASVAWSYLGGSSVDVMFSHEWAESEDPRVPSGWDVAIEDLRINGADICDLWNELPKPVQMSLYRAVEAYLDGEAKDSRDSAAIDAYEARRAA